MLGPGHTRSGPGEDMTKQPSSACLTPTATGDWGRPARGSSQDQNVLRSADTMHDKNGYFRHADMHAHERRWVRTMYWHSEPSAKGLPRVRRCRRSGSVRGVHVVHPGGAGHLVLTVQRVEADPAVSLLRVKYVNRRRRVLWLDSDDHDAVVRTARNLNQQRSVVIEPLFPAVRVLAHRIH